MLELLRSKQQFQKLVVIDSWLSCNADKLKRLDAIDLVECSKSEMKKISSLQTPSPLLAVAEIPSRVALPTLDDLTLVLDGLQDPGNLGTIIRTADWFGLKHVILSDDTVDAYNPKTVQSAMGSLLRVETVEKNLDDVFTHYADIPVYAADMKGEDIREIKPKGPALLVIGNEGNGIKAKWDRFIHQAVSIPRFGDAESLNAAVAASIVCACWKMR